MSQKTRKYLKLFLVALSSNWFFAFVLIFFAFEMVWVATSSIYPMLFDEEYHLGVIDIYSKQISPFITTQPPEAAFHGDITRYGSYLFHYLMSFPYRFAVGLGADLQTTIILMRLICISFVLLGIYVFRKFLLSAGLSRALSNTSIFIFTTIPLVPFALAQINYDSLAFLSIATILYLSIYIIKQAKNKAIYLLLLVAMSGLACIVKFTVLPIAFASILFVLTMLYRKYRKKFFGELFRQAGKTKKVVLVLVVLLSVLSLGMFTERYGQNLIKYKNIEPKCHKIHSVSSCMQYTVWRRDTTWKKANDAKSKPRNNPIVYTASYWAPRVFNDFFVVAAFVYEEEKPLEIRYLPTTMQGNGGNKILKYFGWIIATISLLLLAVNWRKLPHKQFRYLVALIVGVFALSMWLRNYSDYLSIGAGTAAQGRYFIALLIPILALVGLAWSYVLKKTQAKILFLLVCILFITQGGGISNFILYSNPQWYWPEQRKMIKDINTSAKKIIRSYTLL